MNGKRSAMLVTVFAVVLALVGCGHVRIRVEKPASRVALISDHGQYVVAKGEEDNWVLRQVPELNDDCSWFALRHLEKGKVALVSCFGRYVTVPRSGETRRDWALVQERGLGKCGEFVWLDLPDDRVALFTCAGRFVTAGDGNWDAGDEWLLIGEIKTIGTWEYLEIRQE